MNYPITGAGLLLFLAFLAHTLVGIREVLSTRPRRLPADDGAEAAVLERNWVQALCAFQLVTVDLFVLAALCFVLGATELVPDRRSVARLTACFLALWGGAWLVQLLVLRRSPKELLLLGQWVLCFLCSGLLLWGAQSL